MAQEQPTKQLAAILIRGSINLNADKLRTLELLKLQKRLVCGIFPDTPVFRGMLNRVQEVITWGEVDATTVKKLQEKRGNKSAAKAKNPHFFLHPPRGGFERKGIKQPFSQGGANGYRGDKMAALIERML